jgi:hypothetical protein
MAFFGLFWCLSRHSTATMKENIQEEEIPFPTSEEAKVILRKAGIDTTDLMAKVRRRLCDLKGHDMILTWPLDPREYTCKRCGRQELH